MLLAVPISTNGCTWDVLRALKKLEFTSATPRATLTLLSMENAVWRQRAIETLSYLSNIEVNQSKLITHSSELVMSLCSNEGDPTLEASASHSRRI